MDLVLRQVVLSDGRQADIVIQDGYIAAIEPVYTGNVKSEIMAKGLCVPAFVNGHLHACKSFWREGLARLGTVDLQNAAMRFAAIAQVKRQYTPEDVLQRAERSLRLGIQNGSCAFRLFADVDSDAGLRALEGLLALREKYRQVLPIQVVAFPQNGVFSESALTERLLDQALDLGVDAIGGIPWLEPSDEAQKAHVDLVLSLAQKHVLPAHFVLDDTDDPTSRSAEYVAARTIVLGLQGQVNGTQANALAYYDDAHAERVIGLLKQAKMTIFANAHIALVTARMRRQPAPRGMTRVRELLAAGVPVATAQDDIDNPYYPFGRNDLLEVGLLMAHLAPLAWGSEIDQVLEMLTHIPAMAIGLKEYGLEPGCKANLVVLDAANWRDALHYQAQKSLVVIGGRIVAQCKVQQQLHI